ncbi:3-keto-disaccharide hydrolase [Spongiimicrobium sp. 2-473A-2-J]|uniref:3-keto-disaccharide hydrolase n=1 Tax=Eudoraea algarum TaxID=3417568 RepID=UPI003D364945
MKLGVKSIVMGILLVGLSATAQEKSLFNGEDLTGWTIYGTEKWYVEDGLLVSESGPDKQYGYLATEESYKNFVLQLEFKQEANGNSGVFIRSSVEGTKVSGWQVEVAPAGKHTGGVYESYGRGWLIKPEPEKEGYLKQGEWNTLKIKVVGDKLTSWLNGKEMVHIEDQKIGEGNGAIALQIHDGGGIKVKWRNIKVKQL